MSRASSQEIRDAFREQLGQLLSLDSTLAVGIIGSVGISVDRQGIMVRMPAEVDSAVISSLPDRFQDLPVEYEHFPETIELEQVDE